MTSEPSSATWLYTRGSDSVLMQTGPAPDGFEVLINGPGPSRLRRTFADANALLRFQAEYERALASTDYTLERFTHDRRSGERRRQARASTDRRMASAGPA
jgi:hypothetical protein